jgi:hypothetical protein
MDNDEQDYGEEVGCPTQKSNVDELECVQMRWYIAALLGVSGNVSLGTEML